MKIKYLLILAFFLSKTILCQSANIISPSDSLIEYTGRIDFSNSIAPRFSYSGVSIRASFEGTSVSVILDDEFGLNYYYFILDGIVSPKIKTVKGINTYLAGIDLPDTAHEIEVFRLTELGFGKTSFMGFVIDEEKKLIPLSDKRTKVIEFIGNSITCGYGNEGILGEKFSDSTENHYLTYAAITSRNFNARHISVAKSGIGIYRNYGGPADGNNDCMPNFYSRIFLYDEEPLYNFNIRPDLICIDLGTNDFSTIGGDSAKYVNGYINFIDTLQTKYANTDIICLLGPMITDSTLICVRNYLKYITFYANQKGKGNVYFFEMSQQTGDLGMGIDYHPSVKQHFKNAEELTNFISSIRGWKIVANRNYKIN